MVFVISLLLAYFLVRASREVFTANARKLQVAALVIVGAAFVLFVASIGSPEWAVSDAANFAVTVLVMAFVLQLSATIGTGKYTPDATFVLIASDTVVLLLGIGVVFEHTTHIGFRVLAFGQFLIACSANAYSTIQHCKEENTNV